MLTISGNYTQSGTGALSIDLGGQTSGSQYDRLAVTGTATLGGSLSAALFNSYTPTVGTAFDVMTFNTRSGTFASFSDNGIGLSISYSGTKVTLTTIQLPTISSANATAFTVGVAGSFSVTTTGTPTPSIACEEALRCPAVSPSWTTAMARETLSGTPGTNTTGTYALTFTATNTSGSSAPQNFTLTVNQLPTITSTAATTFLAGSPGTFTVATTGFPTPSIARGGVTLPSGVAFVDNGDGTGTLSGTPERERGRFVCTDVHRDGNSAGSSAVQNFTLTVNQTPIITSAPAVTFTQGSNGSFSVNAKGFPIPAIALGGVALPSGVTFVDNGNATGTLSGMPGANTDGTYALTFTATNSVGSSSAQNFTLTVNQLPAVSSAPATTFTVGNPGTFTVTTTGFPVPSIALGGAALPSGVTFIDNADGTGTLSGTPAANTGGTYALTFTATNTLGSNPAQNFTLTVNQTPVITSGASVTFVPGSAGSFTVTTTGFPAPSITRGGVNLPSGVSFVDNGNGTGTLSGTPALNMDGTFAITFTATNAAGSTPAQNFSLIVDQSPAITSAANAIFSVANAGNFTVTTTGFPMPSIVRGGTLPSGVTFVDNGDGTGTLSGSPNARTQAARTQ